MGIRTKIAAVGIAVTAMVGLAAAPASAASSTPTLYPGSKGTAVKTLQKRLKALHYDPGTVNGKYGQNTEYAVWAFERVNGLTLTKNGKVGAAFWKKLNSPRSPKVLKPKGGANRVEVNKTTQVATVYVKNTVALISHVSTGGGYYYTCSSGKGRCYAHTPDGDYKIYYKINGWHRAALGYMYRPLYFRAGGYALHGDSSVPWYPASHGCVRFPNHTTDILWTLAGLGTKVYIRG